MANAISKTRKGEIMANNENEILYALARFNFDFNCPEYMSKNGCDYTLHPDKAQAYTFEQALHWHKYFGGRQAIRRFPTSYEEV
jgi:hypothetical protein